MGWSIHVDTYTVFRATCAELHPPEWWAAMPGLRPVPDDVRCEWMGPERGHHEVAAADASEHYEAHNRAYRVYNEHMERMGGEQ